MYGKSKGKWPKDTIVQNTVKMQFEGKLGEFKKVSENNPHPQAEGHFLQCL